MKRSLSAPCLAEEGNLGSKKTKEDQGNEPTGREYLQLALARVLELQRQVKDETYASDATSDLGESDSEEDVMREVLIKVFKDLPGSSPAVASIINRATRPQPSQVAAIMDQKIQLSGYDTCRQVALEFMNSVVKSTPTTERDLERFETGKFSIIEGRKADHKTGLRTRNRGENSEVNYKRAPRSLLRNIAKGIAESDANRGPIRNPRSDALAVSRDYEIRVRMLKGLDLHLATKQRDFTARLMRQ